MCLPCSRKKSCSFTRTVESLWYFESVQLQILVGKSSLTCGSILRKSAGIAMNPGVSIQQPGLGGTKGYSNHAHVGIFPSYQVRNHAEVWSSVQLYQYTPSAGIEKKNNTCQWALCACGQINTWNPARPDLNRLLLLLLLLLLWYVHTNITVSTIKGLHEGGGRIMGWLAFTDQKHKAVDSKWEYWL